MIMISFKFFKFTGRNLNFFRIMMRLQVHIPQS